MMELSHSLTLNEEVLAQIAEAKRPVFVFEWLRFLDKVLIAAQKADIKGCQKKLVEQLTNQLNESPGPPARKLIARCLSTLFSVGDTFLLFDAVNRCNDIIRNKDDCPSYLPTRLAAICCVGTMYEKLGRMMGRSCEETVQILLKSLRNAESQARCEIMMALEKICRGMGTAANVLVKDIYKAARYCMADRAMAVRCAAARCILEMVLHTSFLYTTELESLASLCFRAFDGSNYDVRCTVGKLLGVAMATTQQPSKFLGKAKLPSLEEVLGILMMGFLRGGIGFLKVGAGEMIKGASGVCREIRVGVTHAYVVFVQTMGGTWLERHVPVFLQHCLELASNPKAASTHVDAVYSRKCVGFVLRSALGHLLGEKAQAAACKELCQLLVRLMNEHDKGLEAGGGKDGGQESLYAQHGIVCALNELGCLVQSLGTTASALLGDPSAGIVDTVQSALLHPAPAARLSAAWCLRCVAVAVPSQLTPLVDRCVERLESLKASAEAVSGYSATLAAAAGAARLCPLGVPHSKGKVIFNVAEDLLRSASQNSRLSLPRTQAGWLLVGAVMTLGTPVVRGLLHRMLLLWKISFPKSAKELESEKARGDAFTWQVTLEGRAGALASMRSFLAHCPELLTPDALRRILSPIESALTMLTSISGVVKSYGQHLKASAALVRQRLYETLSLLPPQSFEGSNNALLRILVAEFTLTENPANTTTSLLRAVCHMDDRVILGSWLQETDHKMIEDQMEPNRKVDKDSLQPNSAPGSGALEHDPTSLYALLAEGDPVPGPLPLGVSVIDASVSLFGLVFPHVAHKHRLQMLEHFAECIKQAKSLRQEAMQINVFTAVLCGMKGLADSKMSFGQDDVRKAAINLVMSALTHSNPVLRCAAGEALGRMAQVVGDSRFVAEVTQNSFDRLKSARDAVSRTGHSLALGCVHRYVGGMGSGQHLNTSVSILLALAQDVTSPAVQVWALHALSLIADSGGPMFRAYVEPTLSLALKLLLHVSPSSVDVLQCIGKLLSALITTVGPELQGNTNSICTARSSFLCACAVMQDHEDPLVQAEATSCLQQLHMFAPRHVNLSSLVPDLCRTLGSPHLLLRRAAVSCLRQLAQREAREICDHALTLVKDADATKSASGNAAATRDRYAMTDAGLPGVLFAMLDTETDRQLVADVQQCVTSMLQSLAEHELGRWLGLCKGVLTVSLDANGASSLGTGAGPGTGAPKEADNDAEADDDQSRFRAGDEPATRPAVVPRWPTRVFAAESVRKVIAACEGRRDHLDLTLARERVASGNRGNLLVLHLSDLIRVAFMAATSDSDQLRLEGLKTLQLVIDRFAHVPEPEFPGHVILEQYQAQVGAALRPAFSADTPPHVTAAACQVCSAWIGSGVARDLNDLRRVHQLLVTSLSKLNGCASSQLFNESTATLEKLAILKAWSEVYVVAMSSSSSSSSSSPSRGDGDSESDADSDAGSLGSGSREGLLELVAPELPALSRFWLAALKDHALLSLPAEFVGQLPPNGGAFYSMDTMDSARQHYRASWPSLVRAAALWLDACGLEGRRDRRVGRADDDDAAAGRDGAEREETNVSRFHLVFGICLEALCSPRSMEPLDTVVTCLHSLRTLLDSTWSRSVLGRETELCVELCNVLHRLLLTRECLSAQLLVMDVVRQVVKAAQEDLRARRKRKLRELGPANQEPKGPDESLLMAEGGEDGDIVPGKSVVFAVLEVCLCVLVRQVPALNPSLPVTWAKSAAGRGLCADGAALVATALGVMTEMPGLCSPAGSVAVLPSILFLLTGTLKETARDGGPTRAAETEEPVRTALRCLKTLAASPYARDRRCSAEWEQLLRSALAKVLDITKTGPDKDGKVDEACMLLAVAALLLNAPPRAVCVPNLRYPCLNLLKQAFESDSLQVRLRALECVGCVFRHEDRSVSTPYVHALAPGIVQHLCGQAAASPSSEAESAFTVECMGCVETLVAAAEPQNRIDMMGLAVPVLVRLLRDDRAASPSPVPAALWTARVHEAALKTLMRIGPKYPAEFRLLMARAPGLRVRLETAVKESQEPSRSADDRASPSSNCEVSPQPSIQLKTDFSHFTG